MKPRIVYVFRGRELRFIKRGFYKYRHMDVWSRQDAKAFSFALTRSQSKAEAKSLGGVAVFVREAPL